MSSVDIATLAASLDQTLLKPDAGFGAASEWMESSRDAGFATLCVSPYLVPLATQHLAGTVTGVCSVVGFPLGYALTETKTEESIHLVELGCVEIDMVMNIGAFLEGDHDFVRDDIESVVIAVSDESQGRALVKVIIETGYLEDDNISRASELVASAGAAFVKTSTGFGPRGASARDVELMRAAVGEQLGVKAAGGIRDLDAALEMLQAGADRIGTSAGLKILEQAASRGL